MERRDFFRKSLGAAIAMGAVSNSITAGIFDLSVPFVSQSDQELKLHKLDGIEFTDIKLSYPRQVGKNSIKGIHGFGPSMTVATLKTDRSATD